MREPQVNLKRLPAMFSSSIHCVVKACKRAGSGALWVCAAVAGAGLATASQPSVVVDVLDRPARPATSAHSRGQGLRRVGDLGRRAHGVRRHGEAAAPRALREHLNKLVARFRQGAAEIRLRGNFSRTLPKKPYRLELEDDASLLGMPADDDWVLYAAYNDRTPGARYVYRVKAADGWSEWLPFTTAEAQPAPFRFLYFGDTQNDIHHAARGLTVFDVSPSRVEKDLQQWQGICDWLNS